MVRPVAAADYDRTWNRIGQIAGYVAAGSFLIEVVFFLLDNLGILGAAPAYKSTAAGAAQDEFNYWIGFFGHQRVIVWDIFIRDSFQVIGNLAIIAVALAVFNLVGRGALAQLALAAFAVGAIFSFLDALAWLTLAESWRFDWSQSAPAIMLPVGRDTAAVMNLTHLYTDMASVAQAIGLVMVGLLARPGGELPPRLRYLAFAGAALIIASVVAAETQLDVVGTVTTLLSVLVFPAILVWLGWHFQQLGRAPKHL